MVVQEHRAGFWQAFPAFAPELVAFADGPEEVLNELALFLGAHFAELPADRVAKFEIPEGATLHHVAVLVPRSELPRVLRMRTAIDVPAIGLEGKREARWVVIPPFGHVTYVPMAQVAELDAQVAREVLRIAAAKEIDGIDYLDLLPPLGVELERPVVEIDTEKRATVASAHKERWRARRREQASRLLNRVGRLVEGRGSGEQLHRDTAQLGVLLSGAARCSVVLVGRAEVGKSSLLQSALGQGSVRKKLAYRTSGAELVAGQSGFGELQQRVAEVMNAAELLDAVLWFDSLGELFAGHAGSRQDLAALMLPYLERGRVRVLGELTPQDFDRLEHRHVGFFSHLLRYPIEPLSPTQTVDVLLARSATARVAGQPFLSAQSAALVVDLVERYEPYRALPGKAVAFLQQLQAAELALGREESLELDVDAVFRGVSVKTGVPEFLLRDERSMKLQQVIQFFEQRLVGQKAAVCQVAETLCTVKAGLQAAAKPLATLLFIGPTGVGKTELAKSLARFLFGSEARMVRFDMSEYADFMAAERLIQGTAQSDGQLTRRIREQPFTVLLLDEIEKAHPAVFDLLLQVAGEGRLSDAQGKVAYFNNATIIMTSNLGAQHRRATLGFAGGPGQDSSYYLGQVREHFRPEFINRLDRIVCFHSLDREQITQVTDLAVRKIASRSGLEERGIQFWISPLARWTLAEAGFSEAYGARGLQRHLELALVAPMAAVLARLGSRAEGQLVTAHAEAEEVSLAQVRLAVADGSITEQIAMERRGGLSIRIWGRPGKRPTTSVQGLRQVGDIRRTVDLYLQLGPIQEMEERRQQLVAELSQSGLPRPGRRRRRNKHSGAVISGLSAELAALNALYEPLLAARRQIHDVEGLLLEAVYERIEPELLLPDAAAAFNVFRGALLEALAAQAEERELVLAIHELDEHRVLDQFFFPLLDFLEARRITTLIHVHRGERDAKDEWPSLNQRAWGPPRSIAEYRAQWQGKDRARPFDSVLVRFKGAGVGAWLGFCIGRVRYYQVRGFGELWIRYVSERFEPTPDEYNSYAFRPNIDRSVGRNQPHRFEFPYHKDVPAAELKGAELFEYYHGIVFEWIIERAAQGDGYLAQSQEA